jgi:hypothetical protein
LRRVYFAGIISISNKRIIVDALTAAAVSRFGWMAADTVILIFALALLYALTHGFMANPLTVAGTAATSTPKAVLIR